MLCGTPGGPFYLEKNYSAWNTLAQTKAANSKILDRRINAAGKADDLDRGGGGGGGNGGNMPDPTAMLNTPACPTLPELSVEWTARVYLCRAGIYV